MADFLPVYQGNADLGVGTGVGVGGPENKDFASSDKALDNAFALNTQTQQDRLKLLADTQKTIGVLDQEFNVKKWQQQVQDRDNMYNQFLKGGASVEGGALTSDDPALNTARDDYYKAYKDWAVNINDREKAKEFKAQQDKLGDIAARLATRKTVKEQQESKIAAMEPGKDKDAMQANLDAWLNAKEDDGRPVLPTVWQKLSEFDQKKFGSQAVTRDVVTKSKDGLYSTTTKVFDYPETYKNVLKSQTSGEDGSKSNSYIHTYWDQYTPQQQKFLIDESKAAADEYNALNGLTGKDAIQPISAMPIGQDAQGNPVYKLADDEATFATKFLMLDNPAKTGQEEGNEFALKVKKEKDDYAIDKEKNAIGWAKLGIEGKEADAKIKLWNSKTEGSPQAKSAALVFATNIYGQMKELADKNGVITPSKIRGLTNEQLKYLGVYQQATDKNGEFVKGLNPLSFENDDYIIQLDNGKIKVMKDAKYDKKIGKWIGKWDNSKTTTLTNIATNRINEENQLSTGKEINDYINIDSGGESDGTEQGATTTQQSLSTSVTDWKREGDNWRYADGTLYDAKGNVVKEKK